MLKKLLEKLRNTIYINACTRMSINMLLIVVLLVIMLILSESTFISYLSFLCVLIILFYNVYIGVIIEKEKKKFEKMILEKELQHIKLIEHIPIWVYRSSIKEEGRIIMWNGALKELFWYPQDIDPLTTVINASDIYVDKEQRNRFVKELLVNNWVISWFEVEMIKRNGETFWGSLTARLAQNWPDWYIDWTIEDISKRKEIEFILKESNMKLKELDSKKDEFIWIASHELRTPLTSIRWYLSMIIDWYFWEISNELQKTTTMMFDDCSRLINLVNDMLDISKLESWKMEFRDEIFNLNDFLQKIIAELSPIWKQKDINIHEELEFGVFVNNDKNLLKQVLVNLISNAIKFTPNWWKIILKTYKEGENIKIQVIDNWIGIKQEDYDKVFEKFWQLNNILNEKQKWTWLGLSISKNILSKMWSKLNLESEVGKGSNFNFDLLMVSPTGIEPVSKS